MWSAKGILVFSWLELFFVFPINECVIRKYFIGIREEIWDYAPSGKNRITGQNIAEDAHASTLLLQGPHRIGHVYKKAMYKQYTDESYTQEVPKPQWLGYLGPVIMAEVDDVIIVHLKNFASWTYSLHPHGVRYDKEAEGALYPDGTSGKQKLDDAVPPGGTHTYNWFITPQFAPAEGDGNCLTWLYHSHVHSPRDIASGLIGPLLTCKKGTLHISSSQAQPERKDVDKDFFLLFSVVDENLSWYLEDNIRTYCSDPDEVDPEDEEFQMSNKMHAINGYVFGNLPGLEMCRDRTVSWHLMGIGNEVDVHSAHFFSHTLLNRGHRVDVLSLFPATLVTGEMIPGPTGKWMLSCQVSEHLQGGMQAFFKVSACGGQSEISAEVPPSGKRRQYYIAAEKESWSYGPQGVDPIWNLSLIHAGSPSEMFFGRTEGRLGGVYLKAHYVAYTDETFTTPKELSEAEKHLGILGPVIKAETGDILQVMFMNKAERNYSIQPHGLQYDKASEGALYGNDTEKPGASVRPGEIFTYTWRIVEGPSSSDPACITFLYYSATDPVRDTQSGLMGPLLVCKRNTLDQNGSQKNVDKEFFLLFSVIDENLSWYLGDNIAKFGTNESDPENENFQESNKMHVNGFLYGNLRGLELCLGDRVFWHIMGVGSEFNIHGVHFQGNTFQKDGMTRDALSVLPHTRTTVFMVPDNAGSFDISCRTINHFIKGMRQQYTVKKCRDAPSVAAPSLVHYYIAAEEVEWDYSPSRTWELEKYNATQKASPGNIFVGKGENQIGSKYKKAVYIEYTSDTFLTVKTRSPEEEHMAILGPIIRAEVGETIMITFKNKANRPYSVYAHAVKTDTSYLEPVQPGSVKQYQWNIVERSGPGASDPNCICFGYYSSVDYIKDIASGLIGPLVICRKGTLKKNRRRTDVDREFALLFMIFNENLSWYLWDNIQTYIGKNPKDVPMTKDFKESNLMHGINGKLYGNLHHLMLIQGERVDWHLLAMGNEIDIHTVHFHGQTFIFKREQLHRSDVYDLFPATFQTVSMVAENPGNWLLHCHVDDHILAGMETTFTIKKAEDKNVLSCAVPPLMNVLLPLKWMLVLLSFLGLLVSAPY